MRHRLPRGICVAVLAVVTIAGCSSSAPAKKTVTVTAKVAATHAPSNSCAALVGRPVDITVRCEAPISGLVKPTAFPCYEGSGNFYYFNLVDRYVFGLPDGVWQAVPFTQSLGPMANALGC